MQKVKILLITLFMGILPLSFVTKLAQADDTAGSRVNDSAQDVRRDTKKSVRSGKREVRKATGNNTVIDSAKDKVNDAKDNVQAEKEKTKK